MGPIAIVGAACRLPGAENLAAFWSLLDRGGDAVTEVPADRFTHARFLHPKGPNGGTEAGTSYTFAAGIVDGIDQFDPAAFGLSPREAQEMDPQQRLLLEVTRAAIEDAGWSADGSRIAFHSRRGATKTIYLKNVDGSGSLEPLAEDEGTKHVSSWSPNGQFLLFSRVSKGGIGV